MSIPPVQVARLAPGAARRPIRGALHPWQRRGLAGCAAAGLALLALWQIPPLLDWSRYRGAIANAASARLGRRVTIDGPVSLTLLPRAMLVAGDVTFADRGDGISATMGTMRLEVSLGALLGGAVVPRTLTLDRPTVTLPWPIPRAAPGLRPAIGREFLASIQDGVLLIGGVPLRDIAATFQTDPDTGAFAAAGSVMAAGLPWRFTAKVGAPETAGIAPLTLTLDGQAPYKRQPRVIPAADMQGTGGAFRGHILADGTVAGTLSLRGPALSRLGPAPALPWQVTGDLQGDSDTLTAPALRLNLGNASGQAGFVLHLAAPASLDLHAAMDRIGLGAWAWTLWQSGPAWAAQLPATLDLSAGAATLAGETIVMPHLLVSLGRDGAALRAGTATLPGGATLDMSGAGRRDGDFAGTLSFRAPDLRHTLAWLGVSGQTALFAAFPAALRTADLRGAFAIDAARVALQDATGHVDGSAVSGGFALGLDARHQIGADLHLDHMTLPAPLRPSARAWPDAAPGLAALAAPFAGLAGSVQLHIAHLAWPGMAMEDARIDAEATPTGLILHHGTGYLLGGRLDTQGRIFQDGALADGRLDYVSPDAATLPAAWRHPAALWHGPVHVAASAAGPARDIALAMRADLGDLRLETEAHIDQAAPRMTATLTLRHPGAPRLLDAAGLPGAETWLDNGSVAVLAHLTAWPGHVQAQDFSVSAAALRLDGAGEADLSGDVPALTGHIDAAVLALPALAWDGALPWGAALQWRGDVRLTAQRVLADLRPVAEDARGRLLVTDGVASLSNLSASVWGGTATGALAVDASALHPMLALQGAVSGAHLPADGPGLLAGTLDAQFDGLATGSTAADLLASSTGGVDGAIRDATIPGIDLPALTAALRIGGRRGKALVAAALASGQSARLTGPFALTIADGKATAAGASLQGPAGEIGVAGSLALRSGIFDGTLTVRPNLTAPAILVILKDGRRQIDAPMPSRRGRPGGRSRPPRRPASF